MAANSGGVLKSFLVALGFQVDSVGLRGFNSAVAGSTSAVVGLARAAVVTAAAVEGMVLAVAYQMTRLNYSSRLAYTAADNLQAFQFGAEQVGLSAEQATAAVTAMAMTVQKNVGLQAVFSKITGKAYGPDTVKNIHGLIDALTPMLKAGGPIANQAIQQAGLFGIDQVTLNKLVQGRPLEIEAEARRRRYNVEGGVDVNKLVAESTAFTREIGTLKAQFATMADGIAQHVLPGLTNMAKALEGFIDGVLTQARKLKYGDPISDDEYKKLSLAEKFEYDLMRTALHPIDTLRAVGSSLGETGSNLALSAPLKTWTNEWPSTYPSFNPGQVGSQTTQTINLNFFGPTDPSQLDKAIRDSSYYFIPQGH